VGNGKRTRKSRDHAEGTIIVFEVEVRHIVNPYSTIASKVILLCGGSFGSATRPGKKTLHTLFLYLAGGSFPVADSGGLVFGKRDLC
jgi:hypothetical protein